MASKISILPFGAFLIYVQICTSQGFSQAAPIFLDWHRGSKFTQVAVESPISSTLGISDLSHLDVAKKLLVRSGIWYHRLPSRERSHIPPWEKENHLETYYGWGYVSSEEGIISTLATANKIYGHAIASEASASDIELIAQSLLQTLWNCAQCDLSIGEANLSPIRQTDIEQNNINGKHTSFQNTIFEPLLLGSWKLPKKRNSQLQRHHFNSAVHRSTTGVGQDQPRHFGSILRPCFDDGSFICIPEVFVEIDPGNCNNLLKIVIFSFQFIHVCNKSLVSPFPAFPSTAPPQQLKVDKLRIELTVCDKQQVLSLVEASIQLAVEVPLLLITTWYVIQWIARWPIFQLSFDSLIESLSHISRFHIVHLMAIPLRFPESSRIPR